MFKFYYIFSYEIYMMITLHIDDHRLNIHAGMLASLYGNLYAVQTTGLPRRTVSYWKDKFENPSLGGEHSWGGARNWLFNEDAHYLVEGMLWQLLEDMPTDTPEGYCSELHRLGIPDVTVSWVVRVLSRWNYSRKKVYHIQAKKFTTLNVCRYIDHVFAIPWLDPTKVKFLDESRFETRRVRRGYGYSSRGRVITDTTGDDYRESISFTLVCFLRLIYCICTLLTFILHR